MRLAALLALLALVSVLGLLQIIALQEFLYWRIWWFDLIMHFLGGIILGGIAVFFFTYIAPLRRFAFPVFLIVLIGVGIGWEVLEFSTGMYTSQNYTLDTALDLLMDTLGAVLVYGLTRYGTQA